MRHKIFTNYLTEFQLEHLIADNDILEITVTNIRGGKDDIIQKFYAENIVIHNNLLIYYVKFNSKIKVALILDACDDGLYDLKKIYLRIY